MISGTANVAIWVLAAAAAAVLAWLYGRGKNAAWIVVAICSLIVALDKQVDIQVPVYNVVRMIYQALDGILPMGTDNNVMRVLTVGAAFLAGVITTLALVCRDKLLSAPKCLALGGLVLIVCYVCLRWVPGIRGTVAAQIDGVVELAGLVLIFSGLVWDFKRLVIRANE